MRISHRIAVCASLMFLVLDTSAASAEQDGQKVHRCLGSAGEVVFSGLPCATSAITPQTVTASNPQTPLPIDACITSREELREHISAAITSHDANAVAGLMRWRGVDGRTAAGRLGVLRDLVKRPLLAMDAQANPGAGEADVADAEVLRVRTGSEESGGSREHAFGVNTDAQCYWLTW